MTIGLRRKRRDIANRWKIFRFKIVRSCIGVTRTVSPITATSPQVAENPLSAGHAWTVSRRICVLLCDVQQQPHDVYYFVIHSQLGRVVWPVGRHLRHSRGRSFTCEAATQTFRSSLLSQIITSFRIFPFNSNFLNFVYVDSSIFV